MVTVFHCPDKRISVGVEVKGMWYYLSYAAQHKNDTYNKKRAYKACITRLKRRPILLGVYQGNPHDIFKIVRAYVRSLRNNREIDSFDVKLKAHLNLPDDCPF